MVCGIEVIEVIPTAGSMIQLPTNMNADPISIGRLQDHRSQKSRGYRGCAIRSDVSVSNSLTTDGLLLVTAPVAIVAPLGMETEKTHSSCS